MKKLVTLALCLMMLLTSAAMAEGMGVQVIGGPAMETEPVSLDDFKLDAEVTIPGYATLQGTACETVDWLGYYKQGKTYFRYGDHHGYYRSGQEAEFVLLKMDIINIMTKDKNFLEQCEVKVVFDDLYEYGGWSYQYNYNNSTRDDGADGAANKQQNKCFVIDKADNFVISPMYEGHYCFGCTLPNAVINSKKPLRMVITIDDNEITYNIRK